MEQKNIPTILVILGVTGDLAAKKIIPALFNLYEKEQLPKLFSIVGYGRRPWKDSDVQAYVLEVMAKHGKVHHPGLQEFIQKFAYQEGLFETVEGYKQLAKRLGVQDVEWQACSNKLFYLSVPPEQYEVILEHVKSTGLSVPCSDETGWTRILVEKPFGKDAASAEALDERLGTMFREEQIYRIDHYLAKEALQNILTFRFANDIFENVWDNRYVERIDIRGWEQLGVENRGSFYDGVGALRDVGQNHLLQMLALITMDHPGVLSAEAIRQARFQLVKQLRIPTESHICQKTFRAQYEGYQNIAGVQTNSTTETYFKAEVGLQHPKWRGVPVMIEWGKRMGEVKKDIVVTFKHVTPCLCPPEGHRKNTVTFSLEPEEKISVSLWTKQPGLNYAMAQKSLEFSLRGAEQRTQYVEEYEKLLLDAVQGDQTLFVSTEEVKAMWKAVDPIVQAWKNDAVPLATYMPDTNEAAEAADSTLNTFEYKKFGIVGLGKMGANLARRMLDKNWQVVGYNRTLEVAEAMRSEGLLPALTIPNLVHQLPAPRVVWLMVPAGKPVDEQIDELIPLLAAGDTVIDGGNSNYGDAKVRADKLAMHGIAYMDVGTSGGPGGARKGPSLMIGGRQEDFDRLEHLFIDMAGPGSYQFFAGYGAGHFVKMVHNGIEYGMMQALAEGVAILKAADYELDLSKVADIYNHGSVIESRLVGWLQGALRVHGPAMDGVTGTVAHTGEGQWTVDAADKLGVQADIIRRSLEFRKESAANPSFTGQVLSALREQFGGHAIK